MESWTWLKKGYLKKETEGMIMAAQDQANRTRWVQKNIDRMDITETCRMCGDKEETISHIVSAVAAWLWFSWGGQVNFGAPPPM